MSDELTRIYDAHAQAIYAFAMSLSRDVEVAKEILQELFCSLARKPSAIERARDERTFLLKMAHHLVIDRARSEAARSKRQTVYQAEHDTSAWPKQGDTAGLGAALHEALAALPADQAAAVHLKLREQHTFAQIGQILGIPANTAASRYRYGIDKLRETLRPLYEELK